MSSRVRAEALAIFASAAEILRKNFGKFPLQKYFTGANPVPLIFNHFPTGYQNEHIYDVVEFEDTTKHVIEALKDYNENFVEMNLVLFDDAIKHVPVIAVTAFAMQEDEDKILASGCEAYIAKPIDIVQLVDTIHKFI